MHLYNDEESLIMSTGYSKEYSCNIKALLKRSDIFFFYREHITALQCIYFLLCTEKCPITSCEYFYSFALQMSWEVPLMEFASKKGPNFSGHRKNIVN